MHKKQSCEKYPISTALFLYGFLPVIFLQN